VAGTTVDNGNLLGLVSSYTTGDGTQHAMADVWLAKDKSADLQLGDLLSAPADNLLQDGEVRTASTGTVSVAPLSYPGLVDGSSNPLI
jgi:hypothetical protein